MMCRMKRPLPEVGTAMRAALEEAERQLREEVSEEELRPDREYLGWSFDGPGRWHFYVEAIPQPYAADGLPVQLTVYAFGGRRQAEESRLVVLPIEP